MHIDFFFDKLLPQNFVLDAFRKVIADKSKTINFLHIASENNSIYSYLLEYETFNDTNLCLSITLCGYSAEKEWKKNEPATFEIAKKLSTKLQNNVYLFTTFDSPYEMIKITPDGEIFGGIEKEIDEEQAIDFECVKELNRHEIEITKSTLYNAELEENQISLQTQLEYA